MQPRDSEETQFTKLCWPRLAVQDVKATGNAHMRQRQKSGAREKDSMRWNREARSERDIVRNEPRTNFGNKDQDMGQGKAAQLGRCKAGWSVQKAEIPSRGSGRALHTVPPHLAARCGVWGSKTCQELHEAWSFQGLLLQSYRRSPKSQISLSTVPPPLPKQKLHRVEAKTLNKYLVKK